jgi:TP901 family phage tail tape measure protein
MADHNIDILLRARDQASKAIAGVNKNLGKLEGSAARTGRGMGKLGRAFGTAGLVAGGAIAAGLAVSAKAAIDWEDAFQGVVKTVDATPKQFDEISESIRAMARDMPIAATELAAIAEAGGAMGIRANDIAAFTKQVAILGSTTNVSTEDAATALGQLQNVIGLTGDEFDNFAAALVHLGNKGASTEADILEIARRAGGAATLFGIGKESILGWSSAVANLGVNAELGGTALQNTFLKLMPKVAGESKALQRIFGRTGKDIQQMFKKDAGRSLELFIRKLAKLPKAARLDAIQNVFGKGSGITRVLLGLTNNVDGLSASLDDSADSWHKGAAAQEEFDKRNATVRSAITRLKNGVTDAAISIGEGFVPALGRAADKLSKFLGQEGNRNKLKAIGQDIGRAIDKIDFERLIKTAEGVASALQPALAVLSEIAGMIGKLPPGLIGAGGALVITNKITGGLVLSGVSDIVGGLGTSLARSMAASIPVFGRAFVQPVFVTNMGAGLPGGGGGASPLPTGGITPRIGAAVAFPIAEFHKQTVIDLQSKGILQGISNKLPGSGTGTDLTGGRGGPRGGAAEVAKGTKPTKDAVTTAQGVLDTSILANRDAVHQAKDGIRNATTTTGAQLKGAVSLGTGGTTIAVNSSTGRIVGAIAANRAIVNTSTVVNVTAASVTSQQTTVSRTGGSSSSRVADGYNDSGR